MNKSDNQPLPDKWKGRLALLFLGLFALLWSLGSFFFWVLLGLCAYFGVLWIVSTGASKSLFSSVAQHRPSARFTTASPQAPPVTQRSTTGTVLRFIRILLIFFAGLFLFLFLVGLFSGDDESVDPTNTESPAAGGDTTWWNSKGNAAMDQSNYDSALIYYDRALARDPRDRYALYNKGLVFTMQKNYRRSNQMARHCLRVHPDYDPAWWLLGYNYDIQDNPDSALYALEKAYFNGYKEPDFLDLIADVYVRKNRKSSALEAYQRLIAIDSTRAAVYRKMAELDPSNAEKYIQKAARMEQAVP
ncbi:MAG: tetratricopeptide repeat protein [Cytophagales bacterium]|nr:tetratricopeptide repeat protein [Cytophagales bacterium]